MTGQDSRLDIIGKIELFLAQQSELYGDEICLSGYSHKSEPEAEIEATASSSKLEPVPEVRIPQKDARLEKSREVTTARKLSDGRQKTAIRVTEKEGLFESAVLKSEWKIDAKWHDSDSLRGLDERISKCQKCTLGSTRKNFVFGVGNPEAKLVLIGEAPGADEDEQGEPFVGRAGQLLNKILAAVQLRREDVYICNILKCRPPNNRDPLPTEVQACEPFLKKQLEIIKPKLILCLGRIAGQTLLKTNATLTELRGNIYEYQGIKVLVTFHPAALLRNPNWKRPAWEDVQKMRKMYDEI